MTGDVPRRLIQRLDDLGRVLASRGDAIALMGLGSVAADLGRLDAHSDLDFFLVVEDAAKPRSATWAAVQPAVGASAHAEQRGGVP